MSDNTPEEKEIDNKIIYSYHERSNVPIYIIALIFVYIGALLIDLTDLQITGTITIIIGCLIILLNITEGGM